MLQKFLRTIFKNFWHKLGSVLLAIIIWSIVQGEEIIEFNRRIKVDISVANGYALKGKSIRYVDATVRGPRVLLGEPSNLPLEAKIYIPSDQTGNLEIPFDTRYLKDWDSRIKITVRDAYISVFVDEEVTKEVPIREVLQGAPAEGFFIEKIIISPSKLQVKGIKSEIGKLSEITTQPIDISKLNQSKSLEVSLVTPPNLGTNALNVDLVKVKLQLGDSKINKRFTSIPLEVVGSEYEASARPKYVSIVIQGTPGVLSFVNKEDLRAFVELTNMLPGKHEKEIQVKIPPNTVLIETFPQKGNIQISNRKKVN